MLLPTLETPTLTKAELAELLFERLGLNKRESKDMVEAFFDIIHEALITGRDVKMSGFGNFNIRRKAPRPGRNPRTGEAIPIDARNVVTFHASHKLKEQIQGAGGEPGRLVAYLNARLVDPASGLDAPGALLTVGGEIKDFGPRLFADGAPAGVASVDCRGHALVPGLIDTRVFVGEPGAEHKETLASASEAAAAGGITTLLCMPNTSPVMSSRICIIDTVP